MKIKFYSFLKTKKSTLNFKIHPILLGVLFFVGFSMQAFFAQAQSGEALNFDGVDDDVSIPFELSGSYSKEAWINLTSSANFPNIASGTQAAFYVNGGKLTAGHGGSFTDVQSPTSLPLSAWVHVAVTFDAGTSEIKLYENGSLVATSTAPAYVDGLGGSRIGSINSLANTFFNGSIDEVRYWNKVLTASEIAATMSCEPNGDEFGLLAYYNFNQGIASGNNTGITSLIDGQDKCFPYSPNTLNNFSLNGTTSNFIAPGPTLSGTCTGTFPNISLSGNGQCILLGDVTPSTADFTDYGNFGYNPIAKTYVITNTGGATLNISSVGITGANASDFTVTLAPPATLAAAATANLTITFNPSAPLGLKTATITINSNDLDEAAYSFDVTGNNAGEGKSLHFDGFDDRIEIPVTISGSYTKEAWINSDNLTSFKNILSGTDNVFWLSDGKLSAGHAVPYNTVQDPVVLNGNTWYHVAVTYNAGTNEMKLYKNGVQVGTTGTASAYTSSLLQVGCLNATFSWSGPLDEVRIWNYVKTSAEINANMNCELTGDEPGLIAYYDFNQGAAGVDNTGLTTLFNKADKCTNIDGTLINFALTGGNTSNYISTTGVASTSCSGSFENILVSGNGNCIELGNTTPSVTNDTDFGPYSFPAITKTFTITNTGSATLNISSIVISGVDAANFTLSSVAPTTVAPNSSATFTIDFVAVGSGQRNATITVNNSDADEAVYSYSVTGEATNITPVKLISFNGKLMQQEVLLQWETTSETNNSGFFVEKATALNGPFNQIAFVKATNLPVNQYHFTDDKAISGLLVYRLKQVDVSGASSYSNILVFNANNPKNDINIFPNPVKNFINVYTQNNNLLSSHYKVLTANGQVLQQGKVTGTQFSIDCSKWTKGIYFIKFNNGLVKRIVKQ